MRRVIEISLGTVVFAMLLHTFAVIGLVQPVEVSAGSMAPHWLGPHWRLNCDRCGAGYEVGADALPQAGRTACPACGATVLIGSVPQHKGDSLLVDRTAFLFRSPRRWEAIVFRCPEDAKRLCVKRVVGLPGERVALVEGDVYVNGRLVRKSLDEQRALHVLVSGGTASGWHWRPSQAKSGWTQLGSADPSFAYEPTPPPDKVWNSDQLVFTSPGGAATTDRLAYNAGVPAIANPTSDLMLACTNVLGGGGQFLVRCGDEADALWVELDFANDAVRLRRGNNVIHEAKRPLVGNSRATGRPIKILLTLVDRQIICSIDGHTLVQYSLEQPIEPSTTPFAIAVMGMHVQVSDLTVWRDVVYTPRPGGHVAHDAADATWQLADDEYFVVGDNAAISDDSRTWRSGPGLAAELIVGRAMGGR